MTNNPCANATYCNNRGACILSESKSNGYIATCFCRSYYLQDTLCRTSTFELMELEALIYPVFAIILYLLLLIFSLYELIFDIIRLKRLNNMVGLKLSLVLFTIMRLGYLTLWIPSIISNTSFYLPYLIFMESVGTVLFFILQAITVLSWIYIAIKAKNIGQLSENIRKYRILIIFILLITAILYISVSIIRLTIGGPRISIAIGTFSIIGFGAFQLLIVASFMRPLNEFVASISEGPFKTRVMRKNRIFLINIYSMVAFLVLYYFMQILPYSVVMSVIKDAVSKLGEILVGIAILIFVQSHIRPHEEENSHPSSTTQKTQPVSKATASSTSSTMSIELGGIEMQKLNS